MEKERPGQVENFSKQKMSSHKQSKTIFLMDENNVKLTNSSFK